MEVHSAAEYLALRREFTGLEAPMVGAEKKEVVDAVEGLSGRAATFSNEGTSAKA